MISSVPYVVEPSSAIVYYVSHPLHHVEGTSHQLVGRIEVVDGPHPTVDFPLTLSVPVESFSSGNANRDANMQETLDAADDPNVTLTLTSFKWTDRQPAWHGVGFKGEASGRLTLHGVSHVLVVPISGVLSGKTLEATSHFSVLCSDYRISRPALLFMPIDDKVSIDVDIQARNGSP